MRPVMRAGSKATPYPTQAMTLLRTYLSIDHRPGSMYRPDSHCRLGKLH